MLESEKSYNSMLLIKSKEKYDKIGRKKLSLKLVCGVLTVISYLLQKHQAAHQLKMSRVMRKPAFSTCQNKDADQLRGNREADQCLCFRYTDSTISLLPKY